MTKSLSEAFDSSSFRKTGYKLIDIISDYLELVKTGKSSFPVLPYKTPSEMYSFWEDDFQNSENSVIEDFFKIIIENSIHLHNPKYLGHQVPPVLPLAALTDFLSSFLNNATGVYEMGSAGIVLERFLIKLLAKIIGMDKDADGFLTSGGTLGNLTALLAVRQIASDNDIWREGINSSNNPTFLISGESHYSVERALHIMGIGNNGIVKVPVNDNHKLDIKTVEKFYNKALDDNKRVVCLVGNACSTSLGLYDPLNELADFCKEQHLWFHVDAAHGAPAVFTKKYKALISGIEKADSVVIDFHKMMMQPALVTAVLFKDSKHSYQAFSQKAAYLWEESEEDWYNLGKRTFECTKDTMSLKVYATIRTYGTKLFEDNVTQLFELGQKFADLIEKRNNFELAAWPESNIVCYRYKVKNEDEEKINDLNKKIRQLLIEEGEFFIVQTEINDKIFFRTCLMNTFTTEKVLISLLDRIEALVSIINPVKQ